MKIANRMDRLSESITIAITTLSKQLKADGKDVLSFSAGEPDFGTPQVIKDAAIKAMENNETTYTAVEGTVACREAICQKLKRDNNLDYTINEVIANNGAKHTLFNIFQAGIEEGDEVIIPAPYWVTYPELVKYSGGTVVEIITDDKSNFKITPEQLEAAITPKSKMLVLTTPSNPTGSVYSREELTAIADVLKDTNITVISDEMYEKLVYGDAEFTAVASISEDMLNRTITVNGLSKSVAMTGWRFGYAACKDQGLMKAMKKLQSQSTSNINSITQSASITALDGSADTDIESMRVEFEKRRDLACELMNNINGLSVSKPDGAFYLFVNIKEITNDSMEFSKGLLEDVGVAVVPGVAFGLEGYFRLSFATDEATIKDGISRIKKFVDAK
ncbi:MAG: pyridoxal phosphate-dependent aminotransferase [Campylobacteraceae bacterium]|jgi:aspartate aminotransferase|nr:pyridoxal phosphate-dependent aminotransferase [Campylobacteraceae bacterium]MBT4030644.1 pyridoxal phosphate-dependent aminotransferase [Campylobacteraceae bacterium]MBT4178765.1 pyridoxal phosphate-dependent aminotransferase [Campylobacteraceae bacterium]MBT4708130.1 pyridoxal phosphate-dependent aminotransferase [Campylobacteraceae bacterium]MBT5983341.1 pyridoxal phosphate-dependent aminotransferase [Campylobacteraceae bacterium]